MTADAVIDAIGANHHGQSVPADQTLDPALDVLIAGKDGLLRNRDRVYVRRVGREGSLHAQRLSARPQPVQQKARGLPALILQDRVKGFDPFLYFLRVDAKDFCLRSAIRHYLAPNIGSWQAAALALHFGRHLSSRFKASL